MRFRWLSFAVIAVLATPAFASTAWVSDEIYVPIRAGAGTQFRIVHRGIKSGTQIEYLGQSGDWAHIRYDGADGYIGKQYISHSPTAAVQLDQIRASNEKLKSEVGDLRAELDKAQSQRDQLQTQTTSLKSNLDSRSKQLDQLRKVAADPIRLDQANRHLNQELSMLRSELDQVKGENAMLRNDSTSRKWITGVAILLLGAIGGLLLKSKSTRRRSTWSN